MDVEFMGLFQTFKKAAAKAPERVPVTSFSEKKSPSAPIPNFVGDSRAFVIPTVEKQLLFVGCPPTRFQLQSEEISRLEPKWACRRVESVAQAQVLLETESCFAVILSEDMVTEFQTLAASQTQNVSVLWVGFFLENDLARVEQWHALEVHPLSATLEVKGLIGNLKRLAQVRDWMANTAIKKLLSQCHKLPVLSRLYREVAAELDSPNGSIDVVAHQVAKDPVMTAKVLQVINSAYFALGRQINDPCEAVMYLGLERTRSLVLMAGTFSQFDDASELGASLEQVWNHSLQVGTLAQIIALEQTGDARIGEMAFTSGLMHDMGKLILAANVPLMCAAVEQLRHGKQLARCDAERQVLGTTHAELAACLLGTWALPLPVLEAVAWHHSPSQSEDTGFTPLTAVHAANIFATEMATSGRAGGEEFDHEYLLQTGLGENRKDWRESCGLPRKLEEDSEHQRVRLRHEAKVN